MSDVDDLVAALAPVATALGRLGVGFYVGGSVASTYHGAIRSTLDVDLICELQPEHSGTTSHGWWRFWETRSMSRTCGGWPCRSASGTCSSGC